MKEFCQFFVYLIAALIVMILGMGVVFVLLAYPVHMFNQTANGSYLLLYFIILPLILATCIKLSKRC